MGCGLWCGSKRKKCRDISLKINIICNNRNMIYIDFVLSFRRVNLEKLVSFLVLVKTRLHLIEKAPSVSVLNFQPRGETHDVSVFS